MQVVVRLVGSMCQMVNRRVWEIYGAIPDIKKLLALTKALFPWGGSGAPLDFHKTQQPT